MQLFSLEPVTKEELEFLKQFFSSDVAVSIKAAKIICSLQDKIGRAAPIEPEKSADPPAASWRGAPRSS